MDQLKSRRPTKSGLFGGEGLSLGGRAKFGGVWGSLVLVRRWRWPEKSGPCGDISQADATGVVRGGCARRCCAWSSVTSRFTYSVRCRYTTSTTNSFSILRDYSLLPISISIHTFTSTIWKNYSRLARMSETVDVLLFGLGA
jgi:hypothetical protein